jgi:uncharacterized protein YggU (UPF0235/DUF167 family)
MPDQFYTVRERDILLRVKAKPGAREDRVVGVRAGELLVSVRAVAEKGKANEALLRVLSRFLGVSKNDVVLKTGVGSSRKLFTTPLSTQGVLKGFDREARG